MRIKEGFTLRTVCSENIIVSEGVNNIDFSSIINLNESASYLWNKVLGKDFSTDDLTHLLTEEYEVSEEQARADAEALTRQWHEAGLITL